MTAFFSYSRHIISIIGLSTLVACTNPPREVTAQVPLVEQEQVAVGDQVPEAYWHILDDEKQSKLQYQDLNIHLSDSYQSALGLTCRHLSVMTAQGERQARTACRYSLAKQNNPAWYLTKNIVQSATAVKIQ